MKKEWQKGSSNLTGILILIVIITIIVLTPKNPSSSTSNVSWNYKVTNPGESGESYTSNSGEERKTIESDVSLGTGNASYVYQPYEEYITIENYGREAVNITGWQLKNGKDERSYNYGGEPQRFSADYATIPQAVPHISPMGVEFPQDVVLKDGERAIVTTGSVGVRTPYTITSFKENICSGYIEALPDYAFTPPLNQSCPSPRLEPGVANLDSECRAFINTLSSCRTPEFNAKTPDGKGSCNTCVNGKILSSSCAAFIKAHYSYQGCLAFHGKEPNFSGRTWRIFLGKSWEMWADEYETIELYDRLGRLVDFQNY